MSAVALVRPVFRALALLLLLGVVSALSIAPSDQWSVQAQESFSGFWGGEWEALPSFGSVPEVANEPAAAIVGNKADLDALPATTKAIVLNGHVDIDALVTKLPTLKALESLETRQGGSIDADVLRALASCPAFKRLATPDDQRVTEKIEGRDALGKLKALEYLECNFEKGTLGALLSVLSGCPKLSTLKLHEFQSFFSEDPKESSAVGISKLTALKHVELRGTKIDEPAMLEIVGLPQLQRLDLNHSTLSQEASSQLWNLACKVEVLSLSFCRFVTTASFEEPESSDSSEEGKAHVLVPKLRELDLSSTFYDGDGAGLMMMGSLGGIPTLQKLDFTCYSGYDEKTKTVQGRVLPDYIMHLAALKELRVARLDGHHVNAEVLKKLAEGATKLETLGLSMCPEEDLTVEAFGHLKSFPQLREVDLSHTIVGPEHAAALATIARPLDLRFRNCKNFTDDACEKLGASKTITSVDVSLNLVTEKGLKALAKLPELKQLNLSGCHRCTPSAWPSTPKLQVLWLDDSGVGDKGMPTSSKAGNLEALSIGIGPRTRITGASIENTLKFKKLRYLDLSGTKPTETQLAELKGLAKLEWLILPESGLAKGDEPVSILLGAGGFAKLKRLDVRLFASFDGKGPATTFTRMELPSKLDKSLRRRLPGVRVTVRAEMMPGG